MRSSALLLVVISAAGAGQVKQQAPLPDVRSQIVEYNGLEIPRGPLVEVKQREILVSGLIWSPSPDMSIQTEIASQPGGYALTVLPVGGGSLIWEGTWHRYLVTVSGMRPGEYSFRVTVGALELDTMVTVR